MVHPKSSRVLKPFPSQKNVGNLVGDQSLHKNMFVRTPFLGQKSPRPSRNPQGYKLGVRGRKYQSWVPKKPCRIQWSMLQTESDVASYGRKPFRVRCLQKPRENCLQNKHMLRLQTKHLLCQQTRHDRREDICCVSRHLPSAA